MKKSGFILLFSLCFAFLVGLQAFYIYNSYRLEEKELLRQSRNIASAVLERMDAFENERHDDLLMSGFDALKKNTAKNLRSEVLVQPQYFQTSECLQSKKMQEILRQKTKGTSFRIALKNEIYSVFDDLRKKELLPKNKTIVLYQTEAAVANGVVVNESKWSSHQSVKDTESLLDEKQFYTIRSHATCELLNLRFLVLRKIIPLVVVTLLISGFLMYLFRKSLKNIHIQQRKIDQLHTTVDSIAHELNTPVTTLKFAVRQLTDTEVKSILQRQIQRLENISSGVHQQENWDENITGIQLDEYWQKIRKSYPDIHFSIHHNFHENKVLKYSDFTQMMNNLVENSAKYGATEITAEILFINKIEISVSDNGIGIPKDGQALIFDKYYRISREENQHVNGLGIGLFLVKNIAERYHGSVSVTSEKGKGSTFKILLRND